MSTPERLGLSSQCVARYVRLWEEKYKGTQVYSREDVIL
jgi:hypothetical protein